MGEEREEIWKLGERGQISEKQEKESGEKQKT